MNSPDLHRGPALVAWPITSIQAQLFSEIIDELIIGIELHFSIQSLDGLSEFNVGTLDTCFEYGRFVAAAYALNFVCTDMELMGELEHSPRDISGWSFPLLRQYFHTLLRAERWNSGVSSPILAALATGRLQRANERLRVLLSD